MIELSPKRNPDTGLLPHQAEYIEWLIDPERQGSQNQWARDHDISPSSLYQWKRHDAFFDAELRRRLAEENLDPLSMRDVLAEMKRLAAKGDTAAAKFVLDYIKWLDPKPTRDAPERPIEDYSDVELAEALEDAAKLRVAVTDA